MSLKVTFLLLKVLVGAHTRALSNVHECVLLIDYLLGEREMEIQDIVCYS